MPKPTERTKTETRGGSAQPANRYVLYASLVLIIAVFVGIYFAYG